MERHALETKSAPALADIGALVTKSAVGAKVMAYADALAGEHAAHLEFVAFNELPMYPAPLGESLDYGKIWEDLLARAMAAGDELEARARAGVARLASPAALQRIDQSTDAAAAFLCGRARLSDLTIVGISAGAADPGEREFVSRLLFDSGRPLILFPEAADAASAPRRIQIAWRPTRESTRAVHEALPLLRRATEVRLVVVDDGDVRTANGIGPGEEMALHLARHGVNVEVRVVAQAGEETGAALLKECRYFGADLLVMGGYGHSKLREWIFGGVTRDIMRDAPAPILMAH